MSITTKKNISGLVTLCCAVCIVYGIARMLPYGLSGEIHKATPYIMLSAGAFVVSLPFAIVYYYYRGNSTTEEDEELARMRTEVDVLSHLAANRMQPKVGGEPTAEDKQHQGPITKL